MKLQLKFSRRRLLQRLRLAAIALAVLWLGYYAMFGPQGYLALRHRQHQVADTMQRLHQLEDQNRELNRSVRALRSDPSSIETIARERLHLTRPGEVVYTYPTQPASVGTHAAALH